MSEKPTRKSDPEYSKPIPVSEMRGHGASSPKSLKTKELMRKLAQEQGLKLP